MNEFNRILTMLTIANRMIICENESKQRLVANAPLHPDKINLKAKPANYELELISFRALLAKEIFSNNIDFNNKWLIESTMIVRNNNFFFADEFIHDEIVPKLLFLQWESQIGYNILYYRYNYFFNYTDSEVNMNEQFMDYFGVSYSDFIEFCMLVNVWASPAIQMSFHDFSKIFIQGSYTKVFNLLKRTRNEIIDEYNSLNTTETRNPFFDLNLLIKYPIVSHNNNIFLPYAPYIPYACTRSLLFRLTENNNEIRSKVGKNVFESYVLHLCRMSDFTNKHNIIPEFEYGKDKRKSSDVIIYSNNQVVFIDSKLFNQSTKLRAFDEVAILNAQKRITDAIVQVVNNIEALLKDEMTKSMPYQYKKNNVFGLVLLYDDFYFNTEKAYLDAINILCEKGFQYELQELLNLIKVLSLVRFENALNLYSGDIFDLFSENEITVLQKSRLIDYEKTVRNLMKFDIEKLKKNIAINGKECI
jgi:hypothetical protein